MDFGIFGWSHFRIYQDPGSAIQKIFRKCLFHNAWTCINTYSYYNRREVDACIENVYILDIGKINKISFISNFQSIQWNE
jgi:hypothetical protein